MCPLPYGESGSGGPPTPPPEGTMRKNMGTIEELIRIIIGVFLIALVFVGPKSWWGLLGIYPLATGLIRY